MNRNGPWKRHGGLLLLAAILLIQTISLVYIGANREGLHIDEHFSYILSNSYDAYRIPDEPAVWNAWVDGSAFREFLTVEEGEQFAYRTAYNNTAKDAHPPLFYFLLHTLCSLFPGVYSPWIGMIMNIALILLAQLVLYKLSRELTGDSLWAVAPAAIYGAMQVFADTALFIRMYPLLALMTVLLAWQHYRLIVSEKKAAPVIWCGVITFLGTFTQYYFAFTAFFIAAVCCIFLLLRRRWKLLFAYGASMLLGVAMVFVVFPAGVTQITGSSTNNIGNEVTGHLLDFSYLGYSVLRMGKQILQGVLGSLRHCLYVTAGLTVAVCAALAVLRFKGKADSAPENRFRLILRLFLTLAAVIGFVIITVSHVSGKFVYVRYLYNLFPLIALLGSMLLWLLAARLKLSRNVLVWGVIAVSLVNTAAVAAHQMCSYSFHARAERDNALIEQIADRPLLVLNNGCDYQPTGLMHVLTDSDQIYMANFSSMEPMDSVLEQVDCSRGVACLVLTDKQWSDGLDGPAVMTQIVEQSQSLASFEEIGVFDFTTVYIAYPEA